MGEQNATYEEMVPLEDHFTNLVNKSILSNTVTGIPILKHIKNQADNDKINEKGPLISDNYLTLLLSAAERLRSRI